MAGEVPTIDAEKQFEVACKELREAEQEVDEIRLALFQARKKVEDKKEAKKKADDLLDSLSSKPAPTATAAPTSAPTAAPDIEIEVGVTIVEKEFELDNGQTKPFRGVVVAANENKYHVVYEDGDEGGIDAEDIRELVKNDLSAEEAAAVRTEVAKYRRQKRAATSAAVTPEPPEKKRKEKSSKTAGSGEATSATPRPRNLNLNFDAWEKDMLDWLLNVPHGKNHKTCSQDNAQQVIRQARKLLSGQGVPYKNWPEGVAFAKNESITLDGTNFDSLYERAKFFQKKYGEDKGHGWLLLHPIHKMKLYQEHRASQQRGEW